MFQLDIGGAGKWQFFVLGFFRFFFCFSQWKSALLSYEVSFFLHYGWFLQNLELDFIPTLCTYPFIFLALHFPLKQNYIIINQIGKLVVLYLFLIHFGLCIFHSQRRCFLYAMKSLFRTIVKHGNKTRLNTLIYK